MRSIISSRKGKQRPAPPDDVVQLELELGISKAQGYRHLQRSYLCVNPDHPEAGPVLTPIEHMSDEQIDRKVTEYRRFMAGFSEYIDELLRYKADRANKGETP